jgi:hypothetical protein
MPDTAATTNATRIDVSIPRSRNALAARSAAPIITGTSRARPTSENDASAPATAPAPCVAVR